MTDKIFITQEDIARVDIPRQPSPPRKHQKGPWIAGAICALIVVIALVGRAMLDRGVSIQEYAQGVATQLNSDFNDPSNEAFQNAKTLIETVQYPVTYKGAQVKDVSLTTTDGSDRVLKDESNLDRMSYTVTFYWQGLITTDGYTDVMLVYDHKKKQIVEREYLDTNGLWNFDTPETQEAIQKWAFELGVLLGGI